MMQQIATNKPDIATSSLPLDVAVEPTSATEFSVVFQKQQSASVSAFDRARDRAERIQGEAGDNTRAINEAKAQDSKSSRKAADEPTQDIVEKSPNSEKQTTGSSTEKNNNSVDNGDNSPKTEANSKSDSQSSEPSQDVVGKDLSLGENETTEELGQDIDDLVKYIKYVDGFGTSELASNDERLTSLEVDDKTELDPTIDLITNTLDKVEQENIKYPVADEVPDEEFIKVHVSLEDLQTILAAQQKLSDENSELFDSIDLEQAIKNILNAGKANVEGTDSENALEAFIQEMEGAPDEQSLDIDLLKALLIGSEPEAVDDEKELISDLSVSDTAIDAEAEDIESQLIDELLIKNPSATINVSTDVKINANTLGAAVEVTVPKTSTEQSSKQGITMLAELDAEQQAKALENLNARLQSAIPDLKTENKGSEFVAAMQTGLKEFKEQLKQGREPGIDLKALVADSLQSTNVEIPPTQGAKVDANVQQFNALLNLANGVQQTQNHYANGQFTPSENILLEKATQNGIEGTKLAQTQTNANSTLDKAVNIFKPEGQQQLAEKVRWMINGRNTAAEIRMDPPELGAMQIRINMNGDAASVSFTVQSIQAKEALDHAAPKLREMLQEQGIELGQSSVEQGSQGFQQEQQQQDEEFASATSGKSLNVEAINEQQEDAPTVVEQRISGGTIGGIDYFA